MENTKESPQYEHSNVWKDLEFDGKHLFISDGKTIYHHLRIRLSTELKGGKEYFIRIKTKFNTNAKKVRFFLENNEKSCQDLCTVSNSRQDDYYTVSLRITVKTDYQWLSVTSSDFIGENYIYFQDIIAEPITIRNYNNNVFLLNLGIYAENSKGFGSVFEFINDIGIKRISLYSNYNDYSYLFFNTITPMIWEAGLTIDRYMSDIPMEFPYVLGNSIKLQSPHEIIAENYDKTIPILVCGNINNFEKAELEKLTDKIYDINDVLCYAIVKNCIISPAYNYFRNNNIDAKIYHMNIVSISDIKDPSDIEKTIAANPEKAPLDIIYKDYSGYTEKRKETQGPFWSGCGKQCKYIDYKTEYCISINGIRRTCNQPEKYENSIWFIGTSVSSATGFAIDEHTIESFLQNIINEKQNGKYIVHNIIMPCGWHYSNYDERIKELPIKSGDIVIISDDYHGIFKNDVYLTPQLTHMTAMLDLREYFQRPHDRGEIFIDTRHMNPEGFKMYAEGIYNELFEKGLINLPGVMSRNDNEIQEEIPDELAEYIKSISEFRKIGKNGCIVMNCNPFTLGHRYLIEYASGQVDNLFIFVVEEDKSKFSFTDRFRLVKEGTAHIPNVTVIPSGKFIVSSMTFKAYFEKGEKQDIVVDTTADLQIFGKYIAPALDISVRFAGEEPLDNITSQYNANMKLLLPTYGIDFVEIPRKEQGSQVISASRVRKLLELKDFDSIAKLVPPTTLNYLKTTFKDT